MSAKLLRCKLSKQVDLEKHLENYYCGDKTAFQEFNGTCTDGGGLVPKKFN